MQSANGDSDQQQVLEAADRVARAVYIWIRHGNVVDVPSSGQGARQDMVAGLIFGLCNALQLNEQHVLLSAYAYALIDGEAAEALPAARSMFHRRDDAPSRSAYRRGVRAADDLIALIETPVPAVGAQLLPI